MSGKNKDGDMKCEKCGKDSNELFAKAIYKDGSKKGFFCETCFIEVHDDILFLEKFKELDKGNI